MKNKYIRLIALVLCVFMLMTSFTAISVFAAEDDEDTWEDTWNDKIYPAYTTTAFNNVKERIGGNGEHILPMELLTVVEGYAFYCDVLTGEMIFLVLKDKTLTKEAILEKGVVPEYSAFYCTNPYNVGSAQGLGSKVATIPENKELLLSQIIIEYSKNDDHYTLNSFKDAAGNQQINVKNIRGGVRVEYTIGREQITYLVPMLIRKDKLDNLLLQMQENNVPKREAAEFKAFYMLMDTSDPFSPADEKKQWEKEYPCTKTMAAYVCDSKITRQELARLERTVKTYTDYDYDTLSSDHSETEYVAKADAPPLFKLALEYRVEGEQITIRCNAGNIRFDSSMYTLSDVKILPYGGAGDVNNEGYIFSPDGSGSLIRFSDFSNTPVEEETSLYGQDFTYHSVDGQNREVARLPVFGVYQRVEKDHTIKVEEEVVNEETGEITIETVDKDVALEIAYFAVIEDGDSMAKINVNYGGVTHNYASIFTSFNPRPKDSYRLTGGLSVGDTSMWTVEAKRKYTGNFKLRLFILDGTEDGDELDPVTSEANKSYSDMAAAYRNYLIKSGVLTKIEDDEEDIPLYLETLGALESQKTVLGVPVDTTVALTTFDDTIKILNELRESYKIDNFKVKMSGWFNGGLMGDVATSVEVEDVLGGEEGFKNLVSYAKDNNVTLFPDIEMSFAYSDKTFDGFNVDEDVARTIDDRSARKKGYDPILQAFVTLTPGEAIISPNFMKELYSKAYEDYSKFEVGSISVGSLGQYLSSDFNEERPLTREDSKELVTQLLSSIKENHEKVLVTAGNKYSLPYATDIVEMPLDDSRMLMSYATVPFMSMVLHGYKEYTGQALNLAGDYEYYLLKTIESGANPYFVVAMNNISELKKHNYSAIQYYYSVRYNIWVNDIVSAYNSVNEAIGDLQDVAIAKHELVTADGKVARVEYENGISFYVNYSEKPYIVKIDGKNVEVPVNGYIKLDAEGKLIKNWEGAR